MKTLSIICILVFACIGQAFGGELESLQQKITEIANKPIETPRQIIMVASCVEKTHLKYGKTKTNETAVRVKEGKTIWWLYCQNDKGEKSTIQMDVLTGDVSRNKNTLIISTPYHK